MTASIPLDILDEVSRYLSKTEFCTISLVHSSILPYMQRRLYRSLRLNHLQIGLMMLSPSSSPHLVYTKELHIFMTRASYTDQTVQLLECLGRHGQLRTLGVLSKRGAFSANRKVPSAFQRLISSSPFLYALDIHIDKNEMSSVYSEFLRYSLDHPALRQMGLFVVPKTLLHLIPLQTRPKPTEILVNFSSDRSDNNNWINIMTLLTLSEVKALTLRYMCSHLAFNIGSISKTTVTCLNLDVVSANLSSFLPSFVRQFTHLMHLTLACHLEHHRYVPFAIIDTLADLINDPLESFEVLIPVPWKNIQNRLPQGKFSNTVRSSRTLRLVRLYFAGRPSIPQSTRQELIKQMVSETLLYENIGVIENATMTDMWPK
ncbi:hypothetical protein DL96DRAFT_1810934 [Flagelloscypha sp. PMI_526]|nr:hypothetical protein DL96DRAFT_1810934 [Flagelloscypha sp. PMI_526]